MKLGGAFYLKENGLTGFSFVVILVTVVHYFHTAFQAELHIFFNLKYKENVCECRWVTGIFRLYKCNLVILVSSSHSLVLKLLIISLSQSLMKSNGYIDSFNCKVNLLIKAMSNFCNFPVKKVWNRRQKSHFAYSLLWYNMCLPWTQIGEASLEKTVQNMIEKWSGFSCTVYLAEIFTGWAGRTSFHIWLVETEWRYQKQKPQNGLRVFMNSKQSRHSGAPLKDKYWLKIESLNSAQTVYVYVPSVVKGYVIWILHTMIGCGYSNLKCTYM